MVAVPRVLLLGTLGISGAALAFLIGARAGLALDHAMSRAHTPTHVTVPLPGDTAPNASLAAARLR
jgi:hypothetical protein